MAKNWVRWLPAGIVPVFIVTAAAVGPSQASPQLPEKSAQELLELMAASSDSAFSGTLEQSSELGLPELQSMGPSAGSTDGPTAALELLTADHTAQVHVDGPDKARIQVQDRLAERNVIVNDNDIWYYDSRAQEAAHAVVPEHDSGKYMMADGVSTPADLAEKFLATIDPSTAIEVGRNVTVAGRSAYELVLTPSTAATLVGAVSLTVDAETGVPLSFTVSAQGQADPAFSVAFSSIDFTAPEAGLFEFTPPAGTTVTEVPVKERPDQMAPERDPGTEPTVIGEGWGSIVALPPGSASDAFTATPDSEDAAEAQALLEQAFTTVEGGRALETSLVSVFIADDGRVFAGAVGTDQLIAAAQQ